MRKYCIVLFLVLACFILAAGCTQTSPAPAAPAATTPAASVPASTTAAATAAPAATTEVAVSTPATSGGPGYTDLSPREAKDLIATENNLVIIDVSPSYDRGHLPGAISIPLATLDGKIPSLDRTKTYLVYCHADGPSISGAQKLVNAGFPKVYRLAGNYAAWTAAGYPVET